MFFRIAFFSVLVLELFGCSSMDQAGNSMSEQCYETEFMENDESCLDVEITELEQDLSESDRSIYEMAKRRISDKYQQLYFLRLTLVRKETICLISTMESHQFIIEMVFSSIFGELCCNL